jgi:hypothetical protein
MGMGWKDPEYIFMIPRKGPQSKGFGCELATEGAGEGLLRPPP